MNAPNERTMRRMVDEVLNGTNPEAMHELVAEDYVYRAPGEELRGRDGLLALLDGYRAAFPDLKIAVDELISANDVTLLSFTLAGTHRGSLLGHPATGRRVSVHGMVRSRFRDGQIVDEWEIVDRLTLFEQLGLMNAET